MQKAAQQKAHISFRLNGEPAEVAFAPHKTLLEVLREDLGLTGTKHGCELGECGTCTVLLDGTPVLSCLVLGLACDGRAVRTVEGMARGGTLHPLQETFADLGAAQCGYCTPAFLLAAEALLAPTPSRHATKSRTLWRATSAAAPVTSRSTRRSSWLRHGCVGKSRSPPGNRCMATAKRGKVGRL